MGTDPGSCTGGRTGSCTGDRIDSGVGDFSNPASVDSATSFSTSTDVTAELAYSLMPDGKQATDQLMK